MNRYFLIFCAALALAVGQATAQNQMVDSADLKMEQNLASDTSATTVAELPAAEAITLTDSATLSTQPLPEDNPRRAAGWQWLINIALLALAGTAVVMTLLNRREIKALKQTVADHADVTTRNLEKLARETATRLKAVKAESHPAHQAEAVAPITVSAPAQHHEQTQTQATSPTTFYLSRTDENGRFLRASNAFEPGNSIFVLTSRDGRRGTFCVMDNRDVHRFALMMPTENLTRACTGQNIQLSAGFTRIVTDHDGEAAYEKGQWQVTKPAAIHYE
ncbi:MAG: hypothetical protein IJ632_05835 [Muribaculaceae bacterium]|nr:hypothetical protein [Muribaculaceae bacterium]